MPIRSPFWYTNGAMSHPILPRMAATALALAAALPAARGETIVVDVLNAARGPSVRHGRVADMLNGKLDFALFEIDGTISDAFRDETDPSFFWLVLTGEGETFYATVNLAQCPDRDAEPRLKALVGAEVTIFGLCDANADNKRPYKGYTFQFGSMADIRVRTSAPSDPFDVPETGDLSHLRPQSIPALGRRRMTGRVLAAWDGNFLLESQLAFRYNSTGKNILRRNVTRVETDSALPPVGDMVNVVGFPETDNYNINLVRAIWRPNPDAAPAYPPAPPTNLTARTILTDDRGRPNVKQELYGKTVRLTGVVRTVARDESFLQIDDGTELATVVLSGVGAMAHELALGSRVEVTGVCALDIETWRPNAAFPRIKGFFLVTRGPDDVRVLATPSWWTVRRLLAVIGGLTALLLGILVWNFALRRMVERRSRELVEERTQTLRADLKVEERTRLAVELHDSIAQSLSGVVMEVETAEKLAADGPAAMRQHLTLASRALKSCNDDLRNCLWDLRSQALEEKDMTTAIEKTLKPHATAAQLAVRFNVAREKLADQTVYSVLRIVRELVINAIRHGKASRVRIAGSLDDGTLRFSVTDDGCGFDPDACPGVAQGHFGIEGIRERVDQLGGTFDLTSAPGRGTKAVITLASFEEI